LFAAALILVCGAIAGGILWQRSRALSSPEALLARLPARDAVLVYIDFAGLRRAGLLQMLAGSHVAQDPEYRGFIESTHFDYLRDLDAVAASFAPSGKYFAARGRFDWDKLRAYAAQMNGNCRSGLCRMAGSAPERNISFLPLAGDVMGLAVSRDDEAAAGMRRPDPDRRPVELSSDPLWISLPPSALKTGEGLPAGTRMFARALENAESVTLALGPDGQRFAVRMDVRCRSAEDAAALVQALERVTGIVRDVIVREHQTPNPRDLSGILTAGAFRKDGTPVRGYWPIERVFFEELFRAGAA
jgi:hypothetical protein